MALNITDALDSYLRAKVNIQEWKNEFEANFYEPMMKAVIRTAIDGARKSPMIDQLKLSDSLSEGAKQRFMGGGK